MYKTSNVKKLILVSLFILPMFVTAQIVNIPNASFKAVLVGDSLINTNGDGEIQVAEASVYTGSITVVGLGISDLTGIEAFIALTYLDCVWNVLKSLDVSQNTALIGLYCSNNSLTSLDVSQNTALTGLHCQDNYLTSLDVSQNTALVVFDCDGNLLTGLNVSQNIALTSLDCSYNSLTSLDVRNGNNINITVFNATNNSLLYCISVDDKSWTNANWPNKDSWSIYTNNCLIGIEDNELDQISIISYNNTITIKGKGTATIFNLRGQRVHQSKLTGKTSISLVKGIYLVRVTSERSSITKKVYLDY